MSKDKKAIDPNAYVANLHAALKRQGVHVKLSTVMEAVAQATGNTDWNTVAALVKAGGLRGEPSFKASSQDAEMASWSPLMRMGAKAYDARREAYRLGRAFLHQANQEISGLSGVQAFIDADLHAQSLLDEAFRAAGEQHEALQSSAIAQNPSGLSSQENSCLHVDMMEGRYFIWYSPNEQAAGGSLGGWYDFAANEWVEEYTGTQAILTRSQAKEKLLAAVMPASLGHDARMTSVDDRLTYIRVEYVIDPADGLQVFWLPLELIQQMERAGSREPVHAAFMVSTQLPESCIEHYTLDEVYDEKGELLKD